MSTQSTHADLFRSLHVPGRPLVLYNIWDAGSARAVAAAGVRAIATGSWSVAAAQGFEDGERIPLPLVLANLERIVAAVDLPVTVDLESGYGAEPVAVADAVIQAIGSGAVGCNLEDSRPQDGSLRETSDQVARLEAVRAAADRTNVRMFLNARTDVFFQAPAERHDQAMVDAALERARAYASAGADGLFVPGLVDARLIERVVAGSPLPVNIMASPRTHSGAASITQLASLGVARVSHGPGPYRVAMKALEEAARSAMS